MTSGKCPNMVLKICLVIGSLQSLVVLVFRAAVSNFLTRNELPGLLNWPVCDKLLYLLYK